MRPVLIFDCDGVLLDTNAMKSAAFAAAVGAYPAEIVEAFLRHQARSFGKSRYVLFEEFFRCFLERRAQDGEIEGLLATFAEEVEQQYLVAPETTAMEAIIEQLARRYDLHIASGSDQAELRRVFEKRGLTRHFSGILGSPVAKGRNVATIKAMGAPVVAMVGDARSDFEAARESDVPFIFMADYSTVEAEMRALAGSAGFPVIRDLRGLEAELTKLNVMNGSGNAC